MPMKEATRGNETARTPTDRLLFNERDRRFEVYFATSAGLLLQEEPVRCSTGANRTNRTVDESNIPPNLLDVNFNAQCL